MEQRSFRSLTWYFFVAKLAINAASRFVYAFLPAIARGLGVSIGVAGALVSTRWVAGVATPLVVRAAGREHRRRVLAVGLVLFVIGASITAAFGVLAGAVVGFVLMGIAKPVFDTATQAVVADGTPYDRRAGVIGLLESTWALGFLIGAPIAGWLIDRYEWTTPFWLAAVVVGLITVPILRNTSATAGSASNARIIWDRNSRRFMAATVLIVGSIEVVFITYAGWLEETHGFTVRNLAVLATLIGVGELAAEAATVVFTDRLGKAQAVMVGMAVAAAGQVLLALAGSSLVLAGLGLIVAIFGFEFGFVSSISIGTELQPKARMQFLSRFVVAQAIGRGAAGLAGVLIFATFGIVGVGLAAAAMSLAGAFAMPRLGGHNHKEIQTGEGVAP